MLNVRNRPQSAVPECLPVQPRRRTLHQTATLVTRVAAGEKLAMQALFAWHRTLVYCWLLRFVGNETNAVRPVERCVPRRVAAG
jgi:hypothetical protein